MGQTLTNGIYLPNEGERNCYSGLAANWNTVDTLKGNYSLHAINVDIHVTAAEKEAWDGKADASALTAHTGDTTIHVTAEDKQAWNGKADASALTAHTGNTTIHVTAEDKEAWNSKADASALTAHTGDTTIHVTAEDKQAWDGHVADTVKHVTAEDKAKWDAVTSKADDSAVVHKSGDESVIGSKRFGVVQSFTGYPSIRLYSTIDDINVVPSYVQQQDIRFTDKNNAVIAYFVFQHRTDANEPFRTCWRQNKLDGTSGYYSVNFNNLGEFYPENNNAIALGRTTNKWSDVQTYKVNALEPSSLSLPSDRSARIDISSYFTNTGTGQSNSYTVPANGYIYLTLSELTNVHCFSRSSGNVTNYAQTFTKLSNSTDALYVLFPVRKNDVFVATWYTTTTVSVDGAFFIPCRGNI